jgi:hypothetical protein
MRYLLVVGFYCDVYRKEPRARIFLGDQMIDEFHIQDNMNWMTDTFSKNFSNKHILEPIPDSKLLDVFKKKIPYLKYYEIEIHQSIDSIKLSIEIKNSSNNYTNGFMNKNTLLKLKVCSFFPFDDRLLTKINQFKNKKKFLKYAWYTKNKKDTIFNLVDNGIKWQGKNGQVFDTKIVKFEEISIGGDGSFTCELVKKYGILMTKLSKPHRYDFNHLFTKYFLDKYKEHANQRNTD